MTLHLTPEQYMLLVAKIHKDRVSSRDGQAYVEAHDDKAHLIRIFGFGNFDSEVIEQTQIFEEPVKTSQDKDAWNVAYRSVVKLTVWDQCDPPHSATYAEGHVGDSTHPRRAEAHGNAVANSESYALKRCCVFLGDQYGLSLYNKGQRDAIVRWTLIKPPKPDTEQTDEQPDTNDIPVVQQESLETPDPGPDPRTTSQAPAAPVPPAAGPAAGGDVPPSPPAAPDEDTEAARRQAEAQRIRDLAIGDIPAQYKSTPSKWVMHLSGEAVKAKVLQEKVESLISPTQVALKVVLEQALRAATDAQRQAS